MDNDKMPRVLCVDDEPKNLKLLDAILSPRGYEVVLADDGFKALESVKTTPPDIILLDIMMPKMDGFEVLKRLRDDPESRLIPIVMVTALSEVEDRVKALDAGCDDFISKPFDKTELLARVQSLVKLSYYRRELDEKKKFESVINEMSGAVMVCDADGDVTLANESAKDYLSGLASGSDLYGTLFDGYSVSVSEDELKDSNVSHKSFDLNREETDAFGPLYLKGSLDHITDPDNNVTSTVVVLNDVTEEMRSEVLKQNFLSLISHKLRTPLTIISSGTGLLSEGVIGELNEEQTKIVSSVTGQSFKLMALIEKLIAFTTASSDELNLPKEPIVLSEYLPRLTDPLVKIEKNKKIELNIDCPDSTTKVDINTIYFDHIIGNLFENAVKFNNNDTVKIDIKISNPKDGFVTVSFSDNGIGIPAEDYEKVFDKFYQVEKNFTGQVEGAGLGLPLVRMAIESAGGQINVTSELEKGTTFEFTLPTA